VTALKSDDPDVHKGALEGDRPEDVQQGNDNAPALTEEGLPGDLIAIFQDRLGANVDDSEVAQSDQTGRSTDSLRDEEAPLE
jgi:hypothetical protein